MPDDMGEEVNAYERPQQGVHFLRLESVGLSRTDERYILRGIHRAGLMAFLVRHPLGVVGFKPVLRDVASYYNGGYNERTRAVVLSLERLEESYGQAFKPGEVFTVSAAGKTPLEAVQRSLVHELGHHLLSIEREALEADVRELYLLQGRPVSRRAVVDWREYFCESHSAYVYHRKLLLEFDPSGYRMIKRLRQRLGVEE